MLWSFLGIVFFAIFVAVLVSRAISKPIVRLHCGVEEIMKGNWDCHVTSSAKDEIGALSRAFTSMTDNIKKSQDELRAHSINLEQMVTELERSNRELRQFAYVASHDLQEPLRMVASYAELLGARYRGKLDDKADQYISYAVDGAHRIQQLIQDLLEYSRIDTRSGDLGQIDCNNILREALINMGSTIKESNADITNDNLPTIIGDHSQMAQVFQNLIGNAIKFRNEREPRVHVSTKEEKNEWVFSIQDNGIGIEPEYLERIFVVFQRLHSQSEYSGTGIGLAICKKIVERHGGRIWVESEPGRGSTFSFTIPKREMAKLEKGEGQ
jgi:light-regulated signal transduction histidine kinase (bacteriophytochrome)/HAMP domain-containing protein